MGLVASPPSFPALLGEEGVLSHPVSQMRPLCFPNSCLVFSDPSPFPWERAASPEFDPSRTANNALTQDLVHQISNLRSVWIGSSISALPVSAWWAVVFRLKSDLPHLVITE